MPEDSESDISDNDLDDSKDEFNSVQKIEQNIVCESGILNSGSFPEQEIEQWE